MLKSAVKHVDAFIAPSQFSEGLHRKALNIPVVYLPNFVPRLEEDASQTATSSTTKPYFLFVGRLEKLKGAHTLIPLFRHYPRAQLWIAGSGNEESRLRKFAAGSDNIRFLGSLSGSQLQAVYRNAVALIVPSMFYEVFPLVVIEAFRQRIPVIARNLGGLSEIIEESAGGFLYRLNDELETAMNRLIDDSSYRNELGLNGYETYSRKWTPASHLNAYLELVRNLSAMRHELREVKV